MFVYDIKNVPMIIGTYGIDAKILFFYPYIYLY